MPNPAVDDVKTRHFTIPGFICDFTAPYSYNFAVYPFLPGTYTATLTDTDVWGNVGPTRSQEFTVVNDFQLPTPELLYVWAVSQQNPTQLNCRVVMDTTNIAGAVNKHLRIFKTDPAPLSCVLSQIYAKNVSNMDIVFDIGSTYLLELAWVDVNGKKSKYLQCTYKCTDTIPPSSPCPIRVTPLSLIEGSVPPAATVNISWSHVSTWEVNSTTNIKITYGLGTMLDKTVAASVTNINTNLLIGPTYTITVTHIDSAGNQTPCTVTYTCTAAFAPPTPPPITVIPQPPVGGTIPPTLSVPPWPGSGNYPPPGTIPPPSQDGLLPPRPTTPPITPPVPIPPGTTPPGAVINPVIGPVIDPPVTMQGGGGQG